MITSRRSFLAGLGVALVTAPAIVRAANIMPVKVIPAWSDDDIQRLLQARIEAAEQDMARQMAQSLYSKGERGIPLEELAKTIERDGWWKHKSRVVRIEAPYLRYNGYEPITREQLFANG